MRKGTKLWILVSVLEREGAAVDRLGNGGLEPG